MYKPPMTMKSSLILTLIFFTLSLKASSPLEPVKLDHPRDTMNSFMSSMKEYKDHKLKGEKKKARFSLLKAVKTFDFSETIGRAQKEKTAILLKEVIDRIIVINLNLIPQDSHLLSWRLKGTEIYILKKQEGERRGQFLFSRQTSKKVEEFYERVKDLDYVKGSGQGALFEKPLSERLFPDWSNEKYFNVPLAKWILLLIFFFIGILIRFFTQNILFLFEKYSPETQKSLRKHTFHYFQKPIGWLLASLFWMACLHFLQLQGLTFTIISVSLKIVFSFSLIWSAYSLINVLAIVLKVASEKTQTSLDDKLYPFLLKSLRIFVIIFGVLMTLQNMGVNIFSLLTGLGIGGLAFALAAKDTAANFFGSLMILTDHPFSAGDWIKAGDTEGTVEDIGLRSTKIRTFYNSLITVPNSEIAAVPIDNMGRRTIRRVKTFLGVTYDTPPEKLEDFIQKVKDLILAHPKTHKDSCHVVFHNYGPSSLDILVYFFLITKDWAEELKERQNILTAILKLSYKENISFAFPTRTLHVETKDFPPS